MKLSDELIERALDVQDPRELDEGVREELASTEEGRELLASLGVAAAFRANILTEEASEFARVERAWKQAGAEIDAIERRREELHREATSLSLWALASDALFPWRGRRWREPVDPVSVELVNRGYPMTRGQRLALAEILVRHGLFEAWQRRRRMVKAIRWSAAAACIVGMAIAVGVWLNRPAKPTGPFGSLELAGGSIEVGRGLVGTAEGERGRLRLGDHTRGAINGSTELELKSDREINLTEGDIWLDVEPGGAGFLVNTPAGPVRVTGTSFGVSVYRSETYIDVSVGSVVVGEGRSSRNVRAGYRATATTDGVQAPFVRPGGNAKPVWVRNMDEVEWMEGIGSLAAHWDMDQMFDSRGAMVVRDWGAMRLHARPQPGRAPLLGVESPSAELFGQAAYFDAGERHYLIVPDAPALADPNRGFTVMAWVWRNSLGEWHRVLSRADGSWRFGFNEGRMDIARFKEYYKVEAPQVPVGQWVHVAWVVYPGGDSADFVVNGETIATIAMLRDRPGSGPWWIGRNFNVLQPYEESQYLYFDGKLDDLRVYSEALAPDTIRRISRIELIRAPE